ncbi:MAG: helix-turn-helix domain-containing protein [Pseudomonadales bacterium]
MLATGLQIRAARAALKWSAKDMSEKAGVGLNTIGKIEKVEGLANVHVSNIQAVTDTLLSTGRVRFEGDDGVFVVGNADAK